MSVTGTRKVRGGSLTPITRPVIPSVEMTHWYWNPNRLSIRLAPAWFDRKLKEVDPNLTVTWNPVRERWLVWYRSPRFAHPLCRGWRLLFPVQYEDGLYAPLDERVMWKLYSRWQAKMGGAVEHWRRVEAEMLREKERAEAARADSVGVGAGEWYDSTKISVSMCGQSDGSKFSKHHA